MNAEHTLAQLEDNYLIRRLDEAEPAFIFKHALVQDTAYQSLLHTQRRDLHHRVARAYESYLGDRCFDEYAAILAHHYAEAGDDAQTLIYATQAGDVAARVYANAEAIAFYSQALEIAKRKSDDRAQIVGLYMRRGRRYELMGKYEDALVNYAEMEHFAQTRNDRAMELDAWMAQATILSTPTIKFDPVQAHSLATRSLARAQELGDRAAQAKILWNLLLVSHFSGQYQQALEYGEQAIALARELGLREQLAYALNDISRPYLLTRQFDKGRAVLKEARELWRALGNQPMLADNLNTSAVMLSNLGDYDEALNVASESYQIGQTINNAWAQAHSRMVTSLVLSERGEIQAAIATLNECLTLARQVGFKIAEFTSGFALAFIYASLGNANRGLQVLEALNNSPSNLDIGQISTFSIIAYVHVLNGNMETAREIWRTHSTGAPRVMVSAFPNFAEFIVEIELALADNEPARALALAEKLLALIGPGNNRSFYFIALMLKTRALLALERVSDAEAVLQDSRREGERLTARRHLWQTYAMLGDLAHQRGDTVNAKTYNAHAREMIAFIAAHSPADLRESFLNLPKVKRITTNESV